MRKGSGKQENIFVGNKINEWEIISVNNELGDLGKCLCRCSCGTERPVYKSNLLSGISKSCGRCFVKKHHPLFQIWGGILKRCLLEKSVSFPRYGGRGIQVCEEWMNFNVFCTAIETEIGKRPTAKHSIDRIDNNKGYFPGNVRWATRQKQAENQRNNIKITANGETLTLSEWARRLSVNFSTLQWRAANDWPDDKIINKPIKRSSHLCIGSWGGRHLN